MQVFHCWFAPLSVTNGHSTKSYLSVDSSNAKALRFCKGKDPQNDPDKCESHCDCFKWPLSQNHSEAVVHSCLKIELPKTHIGGSNRGDWNLPSGYVNSLLLKMAIEIVVFPIKNGDFPVRYVKLPEGIFFYVRDSLVPLSLMHLSLSQLWAAFV